MFKLFKKLFKKTPTVVVSDSGLTSSKRRALFFAINDYKGSDNDLRGCINDQRNFITKLNTMFSGFAIRNFIDGAVTKARFIAEITDAIKVVRPGDFLLVHYSGHGTQVVDKHGDETDGYDEAVYLYDGPVIDDNIGEALRGIPEGATVVLMFDSCFSGTITKGIHEEKIKNRFLPILDHDVTSPKRIRIAREDMNYIVISGCGEHQTSADAYIGGTYNGALTFYALQTLRSELTYKEWMEDIIVKLAKNKYDQVPTIEGPAGLLNKKVFV